MSPTRIVVLGAGGRMGQEIIDVGRREETITIQGAIEAAQHPQVGKAVSPDLPNLAITDDLAAALEGADVLIDFTRPEATIPSLAAAARAGVAAVIGTTGMSAADRKAIAHYAEDIPIVYSPNMSVGINVMLWLLRIAVDTLGDDYDVEILEAHHRHKVDAPSGTALRLAEVVCDAKGWNMNDTLRFARQGHTGPRQDNAIGVQVIRGGDVAGDHTAFFLGEGERLEITHRASSRRVFARGALRAASWVAGRAPGLYGMAEVLGL
ncbi:MAG: 4-hydroxy-tetrahydrodipicolinate reductase [Myxococcota bacterium]